MDSDTRNKFGNVADAYAKYRRDYIDKAYEMIYAFCPNKDSDVLDLGCGTGIVTKHLAQYYKKVTGVDKSEKMMSVGKKNAPENVSFINASAEQLPFEDNTFDLATAAAAYHWFDYDKAGPEIYRVLKPNGKLCVFWKYQVGNFEGYLPKFAQDNLLKLIPNIPNTNKEEISENVFLRNGFKKVETKEVYFDEIYDREFLLGHIQSHSTYNLLDENQKEEYKKMNEKDIDSHLVDGNFVFKSVLEMWLVEK